jgi:Ni2+-binding GTPase involved in maturation of urease and hydrogenase
LSHDEYQGPPGTGKTTVIAAVVHSKIAEHSSNTIWIAAQSNVAVKNVAEKLVDSGFLDFKLLVSKDFNFDW